MIWRIAVAGPFYEPLDYLPAPQPEDLPSAMLGCRVLVPLGTTRQVIGILVAFSENSAVPLPKLKAVSKVLEPHCLFDQALFSLLKWAQSYYHCHFGEPFLTALPKLLRQDRLATPSTRGQKSALKRNDEIDPPPTLNREQTAVLKELSGVGLDFQCFLLQGVTGSGKTEIYLQLTAQALANHRQVLILVPEIGLTPQLIERFQRRFTVPIALFHSALTDTNRLNQWLFCAQGKARILIGTRSAVFTPLPNLGLIVVDEEHDPSYKQNSDFRYHGRDMAIMRGCLSRCLVVLGSATPSLESLHNAQQGRYRHLRLTIRANTAQLPRLRFLNMNRESQQDGLAEIALHQIETTLKRGEQVLIFINRRGYAPILRCPHCGWNSECDHCSATMTVHRKRQVLRCHHCAAETPLPTHCPKCHFSNLQLIGTGTERITQFISEHFSQYPHLQIDADHPGWLKQRDAIHQGEIPLLVGTQMFAKGHDFPHLTLVVVVGTDSALFSVDFRAAERLVQLLLQVSGRAGRRPEQIGNVLIQTHFPDHPLLQAVRRNHYDQAAALLLSERCELGLPPYGHQALLRMDCPKNEVAERFAQQAADHANTLSTRSTVTLLGPAVAPIERIAQRYRWQILVQAPQRRVLQLFLDEWVPLLYNLRVPSQLRWSLDVDPNELS